MKHIYILAAGVAAVFIAYAAGGRVAREKCRADVAATAVRAQQQILNKIGEIDAKTYHTATADIRRMLREKYTIAE